MINSDDQQIIEQINKSNRIAVFSHIRPDGDAIGSTLAVGLSLMELGKDVQMVLKDGIPRSFKYLEGSQLIRNKVELPIDLSIVVDCADFNRIGGMQEDFHPDINIDHHITNKKFATINVIDSTSTATAEILADKMEDWNLPMNPAIANALLAGIVNDTLGFRTPNVKPGTLITASSLMKEEGNLAQIYHKNLVEKSFEATKYWGHGLNHLKKEGKIAWTYLSLENRSSSNYPGNDDADLINLISALEDIDIAVIIIEQNNNQAKISWRGNNGFDVSELASSFGGGGHAAAAGATIDGSLANIIDNVMNKTRDFYKKSKKKK